MGAVSPRRRDPWLAVPGNGIVRLGGTGMRIFTFTFVLLWAGMGGAMAAGYDVAGKSVATLQADMTAGRVTAQQLVQAYLDRIKQIDSAGPALHAVIAVNPDALAQARALDAERKTKGPRSALHGIPILIKDNIETRDPLPTTAGSLALKNNLTGRDAPIIARLRAAGAIILGKTNLSEWANFRSSHSISGWSGVGGLTHNPYALDRSTSGSSAGSGAGVSASLAAIAIGTETDGSVVSPSSINGIVGLKPTLGLVSRTHVVPISHSQDTPGPMGRSVADVAALLTVIAGSDPDDPATKAADAHKLDYTSVLANASLKGKRLGVVRIASALDPELEHVLDAAIADMRAQGAEVFELKGFEPPKGISDLESLVLNTDFKADLNAYLATTPRTVKTRTLADLIAFNHDNGRELSLFGQEKFEAAEQTKGLRDPDYLAARAQSQKLASEAIDKALTDNKLDALIMPTNGPSWLVDVIRKDHGMGGSSSLPAISGYPHLTVPMGYVTGLPVGLSFIGTAWSDAQLLALGEAYEQATRKRHAPGFVPSVERTPPVAADLLPSR
jgi:amidase